MSDDCAIVAAFAPSLGINTALPNDCCTANKAPRVMCFQNRVIQLNLAGTPLNTQLPANIGTLTALQSLNVSEAGLQGYITPAITGLAALTSIDLTNNPSLSGSIPSQISRMPALREFYIANTGITGQIPQMPLPLNVCHLPLKSQFSCYDFNPALLHCTFADSTDFTNLKVCNDRTTSANGGSSTSPSSGDGAGSDARSTVSLVVPLVLVAGLAIGAFVWWSRKRNLIAYWKLRGEGAHLPGQQPVALQEVHAPSYPRAAAAAQATPAAARFKTLKLNVDLAGCLIYNLAAKQPTHPDAATAYVQPSDAFVSPALIVDHWREMHGAVDSYASRWVAQHLSGTTPEHMAAAARLWRLAAGASAGAPPAAYQPTYVAKASLVHLISAAMVDFLSRVFGSEVYSVLGLDSDRTPPATLYSELCAAVMRASVTSGDDAFSRFLDAQVARANDDLRTATGLDVSITPLMSQAVERFVNVKMHKPAAALISVQPNAALVEDVMNSDMCAAGVAEEVAAGRTPLVSFSVFPGILDASTNAVLERARVWVRSAASETQHVNDLI